MSNSPTPNAPAPAGEKAEKNRYKATVNLQKTTFPMKANLVQNEPASLQRWDAAGLYQAVQSARAAEGSGRFVFHDGPPYANGNIHLGHMLNKCLKDFVVRSRLMMGQACPFVPGWDCHGLPIEHKVMQELASAGKLEKLASLTEDDRRMAVRRECKKYAEKFVKLHTSQLKRLLTLADYEHPYLTMLPEYEGATLEVFAGLVEQGLVYRQLKAVHWSPENQTALAEAELEYEDRLDPSVYVDFEADDADAVYDAFGLPRDAAGQEEEDESAPGSSDEGADAGGVGGGGRPSFRPSFMIWTTTPWTLPANLAIAVNPAFEYALVFADGAVTVIAKDLVGKVTKLGKAEDVRVLATVRGDRLLGLRYRHPLRSTPIDVAALPEAARRHADASRLYTVVAADYVTLDDGTGLVHTAPGHGAEDYQTGLREHLPIYCPVREDGTYDATVPEKLRGLSIWKANDAVVATLRDSGHLFHHHTFSHSYPHDWRSKTPVIFRATEQWFVGVDSPARSGGRTLREMAQHAASEQIGFVPEWGRNRLRGMLESRPDWCISRQRAWGLPIPAFYGPGGLVLLTAASVRAVARVFREKGSDAWFTESPEQLLRHYQPAADPDAPANLDVKALRKGHDIFDVWFESGSSWHAVMRERSAGRDYPIDLYLEGSDQHRGWFQLSLLPALGVTGRPPFTSVLTHGFMVDKDGRKMSKSLGNTLEVEDLVHEFGAEVCRWWIATLAYEGDIKSDKEFFRTAGEAYFKIRNTLRFMLGNLDDFTPSAPGRPGMCVGPDHFTPTSLDAWVLAEFDALTADCRRAFETYQFRHMAERLYNFCNDTLSATYVAAVKDRLYCDRKDSPRRRRTQTALWDLTDGLCRLLAPVLPHTADEAFRNLHRAGPDAAGSVCVHRELFPKPTGVRADPAWPAVMAARHAALAVLEAERAKGDLSNPLDAGIVLPDPEGTLARFDPADLADLLGVSRVQIDPRAAAPRVLDLRAEPRCERSWKRDGTVRARSDGGMLS
ncbi:MAG: isoleucine--tRNA ligase, partial [Phycisphaerales bacterium]|nr:isoleucine--tRNA ligase [Phycisphaerales bacterium]